MTEELIKEIKINDRITISILDDSVVINNKEYDDYVTVMSKELVKAIYKNIFGEVNDD